MHLLCVYVVQLLAITAASLLGYMAISTGYLNPEIFLPIFGKTASTLLLQILNWIVDWALTGTLHHTPGLGFEPLRCISGSMPSMFLSFLKVNQFN